MTDAELAARIAEEAGNILVSLKNGGSLSGFQLGRAGDKISNTFIQSMLQEHRPRDAILSEEIVDGQERRNFERVWIVDPLDGTREYSDGRSDWAVHVALSIGGKPHVGAVAVPARSQLLRSDEPLAQIRPRAGPLRIAISRTRAPPIAKALESLMQAKLIPMGSAGAKTAAVLTGEADAYLHAGGQYEWDSCAPAAVALGWGAHASRIDGTQLLYNNADPYLPDLLICNRLVSDIVLRSISNVIKVANK